MVQSGTDCSVTACAHSTVTSVYDYCTNATLSISSIDLTPSTVNYITWRETSDGNFRKLLVLARMSRIRMQNVLSSDWLIPRSLELTTFLCPGLWLKTRRTFIATIDRGFTINKDVPPFLDKCLLK